MAVYTKINNKQIKFIEKKYNIGKIENYSGIKKGIENTNFLLKTKKNKYILTIYKTVLNHCATHNGLKSKKHVG